MSATKSTCTKCGGRMEQGFVIDNAHTLRVVSHWAPGAPQKSFWLGTKTPDGMLAIGVFRCAACGFLESYAGPEFEAT